MRPYYAEREFAETRAQVERQCETIATLGGTIRDFVDILDRVRALHVQVPNVLTGGRAALANVTTCSCGSIWPCPTLGALDGPLASQPTRCHAARDGECYEPCPQLRDGEPAATGRHCPIDFGEEEEV